MSDIDVKTKPKRESVKNRGICGTIYIGLRGIIYCAKGECTSSDKTARMVLPKGNDKEITVYTARMPPHLCSDQKEWHSCVLIQKNQRFFWYAKTCSFCRGHTTQRNIGFLCAQEQKVLADINKPPASAGGP